MSKTKADAISEIQDDYHIHSVSEEEVEEHEVYNQFTEPGYYVCGKFGYAYNRFDTEEEAEKDKEARINRDVNDIKTEHTGVYRCEEPEGSPYIFEVRGKISRYNYGSFRDKAAAFLLKDKLNSEFGITENTMFSSLEQSNYISYKKLVKTLNSNFNYNLQEALIGLRSASDVKNFRNDVVEQQKLIAESSYEYTNNKYRKNIIVLEALDHLIKLMEIRTYRLEPKTGALVNFATAADKLKTLLNPKDNRPDLNYFTDDHLNIQEPIKVVGQDDNDVEASITNSANQVAPEDHLKKAEVYVGVHDGDPNYTTPTNDALEKELDGLTSVDVANIADKVKADLKKELGKEITDAVTVQKRRNEEQKVTEGMSDDMHKYYCEMYSSVNDAGIKFVVREISDEEAVIRAKRHAGRFRKKQVVVDTETGRRVYCGPTEEQKLGEASGDYMSKKEIEDLLASVRRKIAEQGRVVDDRLLEKERKLVALLKTYKDDEQKLGEAKKVDIYKSGRLDDEEADLRKRAKDQAAYNKASAIDIADKQKKNEEQKLGEAKMPKTIIQKLLESELEKAEIVLGVKSITDDLQNMAEKISKMQIEDIAALTERLKAEFGVEEGDRFQAEVGQMLGTALAALQQSKSEIDNKALALSGDAPEQGNMAEPMQELPAPDEEPEDMFGGHEAGEGPEEEPLGRAKKESVEAKHNKLTEMKKTLERNGLTETKLYKDVVALNEKWLSKMHTKKKDKGMFKGTTQADVKSNISKLKKKQEARKERGEKADPKVSKKLRQDEFDIRAKHNFGKVNEETAWGEKNPFYSGKSKKTEAENFNGRNGNGYQPLPRKGNANPPPKDPSGIHDKEKEGSSKQVLMDEGATRKHFRQTAETLKHVENVEKRRELAKSHADAFKKMNPRFSHEKFYAACGLNDMKEGAEPRRMGTPEHMAKKEVMPKTPKDTSKPMGKK